jgi:DNA-binding LytR/AlgR family response regulator
VEKQLLDKGFIRCHKGYIVNYRYISAIMKDSVELSNGEQLPLSRRKVNDVRQKYLSLSDSDGSVLF